MHAPHIHTCTYIPYINTWTVVHERLLTLHYIMYDFRYRIGTSHTLINSLSWHLASLIKYGHSVSIQLHRGLMLLSCIASQVRDRNQSKGKQCEGCKTNDKINLDFLFKSRKKKKSLDQSTRIYWVKNLIKILNVNFDLRTFLHSFN